MASDVVCPLCEDGPGSDDKELVWLRQHIQSSHPGFADWFPTLQSCTDRLCPFVGDSLERCAENLCGTT